MNWGYRPDRVWGRKWQWLESESVKGLISQLCRLSATPCTVACQTSLFVGFSRQEYRNGLPFPSPRDLPEPGIEPRPPTLQTDSLPSAAKLFQSCPTLCDPIDSSPPGSAVPGILQARTLEWVAISFSNAQKWKVKVKSLSCVQLSATPWTAAHQALPSMGFSRQEHWSGVPLPPEPPVKPHYYLTYNKTFVLM